MSLYTSTNINFPWAFQCQIQRTVKALLGKNRQPRAHKTAPRQKQMHNAWASAIKERTQARLHSPRSQSLPCLSLSLSAMTYQMHASQWATSVKNSISRVSMMALYCEYLSIFCSSLASLSSLVSFTRWMWLCPDSCCKMRKNLSGI